LNLGEKDGFQKMYTRGVLMGQGHFPRLFLSLWIVITVLAMACTTQPTSTPAPQTATTPPTATQPPVIPTDTPVAAASPTPTQLASTATPEPTQPPTSQPIETPEAPADLAAEIAGFTLPSLTVQAGTTITWTNQDGVTHTATSGTPGSPDGVWDSSGLPSGGSFSFTFEQPGEFPYYCRIHSTMRGTITVE
jgi:plastocyanin